MQKKSLDQRTKLRFGVAVAALVAAALTLATWPALARAESGDATPTPPATQTQTEVKPEAEAQAEAPLGGLPLMGDDYVWFGRDLQLGRGGVKNDVIVAGQTVSLADCTTGGSIRAAAQDISIRNSTATENITVAAQNISIENTTAKAIAAAAQNVSVSGSCKELTVYASKVYINGVVDGDVVVGAGEVEVGPDARIKGTLHVSAPQEPVMQRGAQVGDVQFTKAEDTSEQTAKAVTGFALIATVIGAVVSIAGAILVALLSEWLFKRQTLAASRMIKERTAPTIGTGLVGTIVVPIAIIILLLLVITLPVALFLLCATIALAVVSCGFAGASLFKLVFPKLGRYVCALAGGAIVGVASVIPILGGIVRLAAFVFMLGYALQSVYLGLHDRGSDAPVAQS